MISLENINISVEEITLKGNLYITPGKLTLLHGPTGSGKTTLLYALALMKRYDFKYVFYQKEISTLHRNEINNIQRSEIGYVFQENDLIPHLNVYENLMFYSSIKNQYLDKDEAKKLLNEVNLNIDLNHTINKLSKGEKQRLAIACALSKKPKLLILDEPTSALDKKNEEDILILLKEVARQKDICVVYTSHRSLSKDYADIIYKIDNGRIMLESGTISKSHPSVDIHKSKFNLWYIKTSLFKQKKMKLILIILTFLFLITYKVIKNYSDHYMLRQIANYETMSDHQVLINEKIDSYHNARVYPFNYIETSIHQLKVYILPLYPENKLDKKLKYEKESGDIYLSYSLYALINNQQTIQIDSMNYVIKGVIKKEYKQHYFEDQKDYYIYMPYELLSGENQGTVLFFEDFDSMEKSLEDLKSSFSFVNDSFQETEMIKNSLSLSRFYISTFQSLFIVLLEGIYIYFYYNYLNSRKYELALLKANGVSSLQLFLMMLIENITLIGIVSMLTIILIGVSILNGSSLLLLAIEFILISLLAGLYSKRIDPIRVLRY